MWGGGIDMGKEEGEGADDTGRKDRKGLGKRNDMDILEGSLWGNLNVASSLRQKFRSRL